MRFYTKQHPFYCGIDLHARSMYVCLVSHDGEIVLHRNMKAAPEPFLKAIAPYRDGGKYPPAKPGDTYGRVSLPHALARKYPHANREWRWQ